MQSSVEGITMQFSVEGITMQFSEEGMTMADQDLRTKGSISLSQMYKANPEVQFIRQSLNYKL